MRSLFSSIRNYLSRIWFFIFDRLILYPMMAWLSKEYKIEFMNLGYLPLPNKYNKDTELSQLIENVASVDDQNRPHYMLYEKPLSLHPAYPALAYLQILDVGCGLGNGVRWIKRAHPATQSVKGLDKLPLDEPFYIMGDAQNMGVPDNFFDIIINVESSHLYGGNGLKFFKEAARVLKPGGHLCWIDLRYARDMESLRREVTTAGLAELHFEDVTQNVLNGIVSTSARYDKLLEKAPFVVRMFSQSLRTTYCAPGTESHKRFVRREKIYCTGLWQKAIKLST